MISSVDLPKSQELLNPLDETREQKWKILTKQPNWQVYLKKLSQENSLLSLVHLIVIWRVKLFKVKVRQKMSKFQAQVIAKPYEPDILPSVQNTLIIYTCDHLLLLNLDLNKCTYIFTFYRFRWQSGDVTFHSQGAAAPRDPLQKAT